MKSKGKKKVLGSQLKLDFATEKAGGTPTVEAVRPNVVVLSRRRELLANQRIVRRLKISKVFA